MSPSRNLWSLWDLLKLEVGRLLELHDRLVLERSYFERGRLEIDRAGAVNMRVSSQDFQRLREIVAEIHRIATTAKLDSTAKAAGRTVTFLGQSGEVYSSGQELLVPSEGCKNVFHHLMEICSRLRDDCEGRLYFQIDPEHAAFLQQDAQHFGAEVERAFPTAVEDIAEAASCVALRRNTAAVFHLMRALEVAATVVAGKLGATIADEHGKGLPWGVIATNMKDKIDKLTKGSPEQIKWYKVQAYLESVNRGWRAPTAHPKQTYTEDEAKAVFEATKAFMRELAPLA